MKQNIKYILLICTFLFSGKIFSQSLIYAKFHQADTICTGTAGIVKLYMYNTNNDQEKQVANFRLYFQYDPASLQVEDIISPEIFKPNIIINYPSAGYCEIIDTLTSPNNFYYLDPDISMNIAFDVKFNGLKDNIANIQFLSDSCYFHTKEGENILGFYQNSSDIRIKSGTISMTLEQTGFGCSYETKGQAEVIVQSGTPPYTYKWEQGKVFFSSPYRAGELSEGDVNVQIIDGNGCLHDTSITIKSLRAPKINWEYKPEIVVKEYPVQFDVTEFDDGYNWRWKMYYNDTDTGLRDSLKLGDNETSTSFTHVFLIENDYEVQLSAQSMTTGCDTSVIQTIKVEPAQLDFKNVISPGENRFKIKANGDQPLSDVFVSYTLIIQDRTGRKVYETTNLSDEGWDGGGCPNGTYYFILKAKSTKKEYKYQGTLMILGGNK